MNQSPSTIPPTTVAPETKVDSATFRKSDFSFLDDLHQIIGLVLTGNHQYEVGKAVAQLDERFENARRVLNELPGLQYVKEEQEEILRRELATLATKKKQLDNYLALSPLQDSSDPSTTTSSS